MQSRRWSMIEALVNVAGGYFVAVAIQVLVLPAYGLDLPVSQNMILAIPFTLASAVRSYLFRRFFVRLHCIMAKRGDSDAGL